MTNDQHQAWMHTAVIIALILAGAGLIGFNHDEGWLPLIIAAWMIL